MTSSNFDVANEIVVDVDVSFLVVVHRVFLTDLNLLDQPHECGTVKLLQIVIVLHHVQPYVLEPAENVQSELSENGHSLAQIKKPLRIFKRILY